MDSVYCMDDDDENGEGHNPNPSKEKQVFSPDLLLSVLSMTQAVVHARACVTLFAHRDFVVDNSLFIFSSPNVSMFV